MDAYIGLLLLDILNDTWQVAHQDANGNVSGVSRSEFVGEKAATMEAKRRGTVAGLAVYRHELSGTRTLIQG